MGTSKKWLLVASESRELAKIAGWMTVVTGAGTAAVERTLNKKMDVEGIINTGFCGALDPSLKIGDIVDWTQSPANRPPFLCTSHVVVTAREKRELWQKTGASVVDMESSAVAKIADAWGVPFRYVRAVSDTAEQDMPLDFNRYLDRNGNFSRIRIALAAVRHPFTVAPGLLRLDNNCKLAARRLGDYFADCRF